MAPLASDLISIHSTIQFSEHSSHVRGKFHLDNPVRSYSLLRFLMACCILSISSGLKYSWRCETKRRLCIDNNFRNSVNHSPLHMSCAPASQTMGFNLALAFNFKAFDRCGYILTTYADIALMWIIVICFVSLQA